jgi:hypothetical protein
MNAQGADGSPAPSPGIRLLWWFSIYVAAQLPLIPYVIAGGWERNDWVWLLFPQGMEWWLLYSTAWIVNQINQTSQVAGTCFRIALMAFPWSLYAVHLFYSLRVRRRRTFLVFMWILGAITLFNLGSCADFLRNPPS